MDDEFLDCINQRLTSMERDLQVLINLFDELYPLLRNWPAVPQPPLDPSPRPLFILSRAYVFYGNQGRDRSVCRAVSSPI